MSTLLAADESFSSFQPLVDSLRVEAEYQTFTALLNCYIREFALPAGQVTVSSLGNLPLALTSKMLPGEVVKLALPQSEALLAIKADRWSLLSRGRFNSAPFVKQFGRPWRPVTAVDAINVLLKEMAAVLQQTLNIELQQQIENSIAVTYAFLSAPVIKNDDAFINSEQSLLWGHPFHPTPKSRTGVSMPDLLSCAPEVGAEFSLFWFRIDPVLLQQRGARDVLSMLGTLAGEENCYPCHPWEVEHILRSPLYQAASQHGLITPLGYRGLTLSPTSSVRTLYRADQPYFMKCSIHVRLTNCVRKNAWYELESAVYLSERLEGAFQRLEKHYPAFRLMREPAATSLDFSTLAQAGEEVELRHLQECFGLLYRQNLTADERQQYEIVMAGAVFAWDRFGESQLPARIQVLASQREISYQQAGLLWLSAYLDALLPGVLSAFFDEGIIFEPHLQNTLIGLGDGVPQRIWIRDLEGTKLDPVRWPQHELDGLSARARQSIYYSREKGWQRIAYCLLINNLSEALFHLADGDRQLEQQGWALLAEKLSAWGHQPEIVAVLAGHPIPSKNNLRTRLLQRADKQADYTQIAHPMGEQ
ncbi:IucA/IucC family protein [Methylophaga sp. OBS4]|uniref:IucA/IucC family protein n=1 Tax=Methylophaga sp. OBS4 TaxID=2991935 RepID=UPI00225BA29F|nr:IucA/IucC family protein [Methylophaga sp. OBS4]MCX4187001.1 hypothetical protein [Methylophaga sp. OBS4]